MFLIHLMLQVVEYFDFPNYYQILKHILNYFFLFDNNFTSRSYFLINDCVGILKPILIYFAKSNFKHSFV